LLPRGFTKLALHRGLALGLRRRLPGFGGLGPLLGLLRSVVPGLLLCIDPLLALAIELSSVLARAHLTSPRTLAPRLRRYAGPRTVPGRSSCTWLTHPRSEGHSQADVPRSARRRKRSLRSATRPRPRLPRLRRPCRHLPGVR